MKEIWLPVLNYEKRYKVSNKGRVKSLIGKSKILKQTTNKSGYLYVALSKDNKARAFFVHVLVAQVFVPNPDPTIKNTVNHENGDKKCNYYYNLNWASASEQMIHAMAEIINHDITFHSNKVYKINTKTKKIEQEFKSILEASKNVSISRSKLNTILNSGIELDGFLWESSKPKKRQVIVTNSSGKKVGIYSSVADASRKLNVSRIGIFTSNKTGRSAKGLFFKVKDEN